MDDQNIRHILKRLRLTRNNETVCLNGWEVKTLLTWIDELRRGNHEQTDDYRKPDPRP